METLISQETFDKFTPEEKENIWKHVKSLRDSVEACPCGQGLEDAREIRLYERMFGKDNLQPPRKIKTWADLEKQGYDIDELCLAYNNIITDQKLLDKVQATIKIYQLIEQGYGGNVTKKDWEKSHTYNKADAIYTIECEYIGECKIFKVRVCANWEQISYPAFHSQELALEFLSYKENEKLVEQYHLL